MDQTGGGRGLPLVARQQVQGPLTKTQLLHAAAITITTTTVWLVLMLEVRMEP